MDDMDVLRVPVLIVGGGPVGLSSALFLARLGLASLLVERHAGVSIHPRARAVTVRTMELLREVGLEEAVRAAGSALQKSLSMLIVDTLAGAEIERGVPSRFEALAESLSPTSDCLCAQDQLEPLLVAALRAHSADLRFGTELASCEQTTTGVTATIVERASGTTRTVQADYVIAADGGHSTLRRLFGIPTQGRAEPLAYYLSIYFRADLRELVQGREFVLCFVRHPEAQGTLVAVNNADLWIFMMTYDPARGAVAEQFPPDRTRLLLRQAIGLPHLEIELLSSLTWEATSRLAERFQAGRVFLVGDAAHVIAPAGGFGMNTGMEDAHNLAWKLALVLQGTASPALLTTYEAERRPHAQGIAEQALLRMAQIIRKGAYYEAEEHAGPWVDDLLLRLGHRYSSQAVLAPPAVSPFLDHIEQIGSPGTRAPHIWVEQQGRRISTLDLFGRHMVLLVGAQESRWRETAHPVAARLGLTLQSYSVGPGSDLLDLEQRWCSSYGVTPQGAVLVRPDGFVAWRAETAATCADTLLEQAFKHLLGWSHAGASQQGSSSLEGEIKKVE